MSRWLIGLGFMAVVAGLVIWAVISMNAWESRCHDAGGTVETRFEGFMTIYVNNMPQLQPQYSYHCWVDGQEVQV
ncbi:MAG: hypothetical protein QOE30_4999 [Mycobacterium sp.]|jgi:hypothetical protein|uniref:hypothetical protein n=1 Tax=Mycobacterium sp. TaxID=1785 RepID=UPI0028B72004|nr:hypothetical protein [Mycobacterium sp.]MDT5119260.1 hypothetical protein [Mycobacterium sp.]